MDLSRLTADLLWPNALGVLPIAIVVAVLCRFFSPRAGKGGATRHALWVTVLVCFLLPPILPRLKTPGAAKPTAMTMTEPGSTAPAPALGVAADAPSPPIAASIPPAAGTPTSDPRADRIAQRPSPSRYHGSGTRPLLAREHRTTQSEPATERVAPRARETVPPVAPVAISAPREALPVLAALETSAAPVGTHTGGPRLDEAPAPDAAQSDAPGSGSIAAAASPMPVRQVYTFRIERVKAERGATLISALAPLVDPIVSGAKHRAGEALAGLTPDLDAWRAWVGKLGAVREAVATVPPVPASIWLAGAVLIVLVSAVRIAVFQQVLRAGRVPRREVQREIEESARALGLRHVPRAIMVSGRVPPMIWCGRVSTLVLPQGLWDELDGPGRRAVIVHELAHLRRRDHWVRWVEVGASVLYWWHPLVWWVRHRLREEADLCCDAWVTALLPSHRRAYAEALLCTRAYLSDPSQGGPRGTPPVAGLGVTTATAKRFARRLTMVMKGRTRPGLSMFGAALSISVIGAAVIATPLWACPPEELARQQKEQEKLARAKAESKSKSKSFRSSVYAAEAERAAQIAETEARRAQEIAERESERSREIAEHEAQRAMQIAEREVARAARDAERAQRDAMRAYSAMGRPTAVAPALPATPKPPKAPKPPKPPKAPRAAMAPMPGMPAMPPMPPTPPAQPAAGEPETTFERFMTTPAPARSRSRAPAAAGHPQPDQGGPRIERLEQRLERLEQQIERLQQLLERRSELPRQGGFPTDLIAVPAGGEPEARIYHLPEGKLGALMSLMAREDVPILVAQVDDGLQVQATPSQHAAMRAFVSIINPESGEVTMVEPMIADPAFDIVAPDIEVNVEPMVPDIHIDVQPEVPGIDADVLPSILSATAGVLAGVEEVNTEETQQMLERLSERLAELIDRAAELTEKATEMEEQAGELQSEAGELESAAQEIEEEPVKVRELATVHQLMAKAQTALARSAVFASRADNARTDVKALREAVHQVAEKLCHKMCGDDCEHCSDDCPKCNGSLDDEGDDEAADEESGDCEEKTGECEKTESAEEAEEESPIIW